MTDRNSHQTLPLSLAIEFAAKSATFFQRFVKLYNQGLTSTWETVTVNSYYIRCGQFTSALFHYFTPDTSLVFVLSSVNDHLLSLTSRRGGMSGIVSYHFWSLAHCNNLGDDFSVKGWSTKHELNTCSCTVFNLIQFKTWWQFINSQ